MRTSLSREASPIPVSAETESTPDISEMTKSELLSYADEHGIEGISDDMKKADIIKAIQENE